MSSVLSAPNEDDAAFRRAALNELVSIGADLARDIQAARKTGEITPPEAAEAFERVARATRRTILLAAHLDQVPRPDLLARRRAVIRAVEDAITREDTAPEPEQKSRLEAEFRERLEAPELVEDLASRPVEQVVETILRDMDLARPAFVGRGFRRRPPEAVRHLHALARGERVPLPAHDRQEPEPDLLALHAHIMGRPAPHRRE